MSADDTFADVDLSMDFDEFTHRPETLNELPSAMISDGLHVPNPSVDDTSGIESLGHSDGASSSSPIADGARVRSRATLRVPQTFEVSEGEESSEGKASVNDDESSNRFEVETILDKKTTTTGVVSYLVEWKPLSPNQTCERTWEPLENLETCRELVQTFEERLNRKVSTKSRRSQRWKRSEVDSEGQTSDASNGEETGASSNGEASATDTDASEVEIKPRRRSNVRGKAKKRKVETTKTKTFPHHSTCGHCHYGCISGKKSRGRKRKASPSSDDGAVHEILQNCQHCSAAYHPSCSLRKRGEEKLDGDNDKFVCPLCLRLGSTCLICGNPPAADEKSADESAVIPLFRCDRCNATAHDECLLQLIADSDDMDEEDSVEGIRKRWRCPDCVRWDHDIEFILTYRDIPIEKENESRIQYLQATLSHLQNGERACASGHRREYLLKFHGVSYREVVWVPSRWLLGVARFKMLCFWRDRPEPKTVQTIVPKPYTRMDEILDVRDMDGEINDNPEIDVNAISEVYCKWKKLPYTSATWSPPPTADDSSNEDFVSAMDSYRKRLKVGIPPKQQRKNRKQFVELTTQPECMQNGSLYSHQLEGLNWLLYRYYKSEGCVLADDMGLGKTIQIIGLFATIFKKHGSFPFLIVVPNSTVQNWQREFQKWAPQLVTVCYSGLGKEKQIVKDYLLFNRKKVLFHVVIATYETAATELATLKRAGRYEILVVDEGQRLKNDSSKLFGKLVELDVGHKILLTGTPLQNNLREIFNLMNFLDPDNFPDTEALEKKYNVLNEDAVSEIQKMLKPYILRRTKQEVLKDFPNLTEIIVPVGMSPLQKTIYKSILQKNITVLKAISNAKPGTNKGGYRSLHNSLMEVRKCLNHPYLVVPEQRYVPNLQQNRTANCGKFQFLHDLLPKLKAAGNRVLIFSQMVILLNELEDFIYDEGYKYVRFDGTTSQLDRQERIDAFNVEGSELFIFLISTRAGGVGINLATADTVIIYDVDFNPHQDLQAISRAHRIGQNKKILVLKLMTKNSAEERIMQIGKKKLILDHLIIETMNRKEDEEPVDVASILKYGAQALFAEEGDPAEAEKMIKYTSAEIDAILAHREDAKTETKENSVGGFGFARIWLNDTALELADEDEKAAADAKYWDTLAERLTKENPKHLELGRGARKRNRLNYAEHLDNSPKKNDIRPQKRPDSDLEVDIDFVPPAVDSTSDSSDDTGMDAETLLFKEKKKFRSYLPESAGIDSMKPLDNSTLTPTAGLPNGLPTHAQVHHRPIDPIQQVRPSSTKKGRGTLHNSGPKNPNYNINHDSNVMGQIMPRSTLNPNATQSAANGPVIPQISHSHPTSSLPPPKKLRTQQVNRVPNSTTARHPLTGSSSPRLPPGYTTPFANTPNIATGAYSANAYHRMVPTSPLQNDIDQSPMISSHPQGNMSYNLNATFRPVDSLVQRNVDPSRIALNSANKVENPNAMYPNVNARQRKGLSNFSSPISNDASFANARTKNGASAAKLNMRDTVANGGYVRGNGNVGSASSASKLGGTTSATFSGTRTPHRTGLLNSTASGPTSGARSSTGGYKGSFDLPNVTANSAHVQRNNVPSPSRFAKLHAGKTADGSLPGVSPAHKGLPNLSSSNMTDRPLSSGPTTNNGLTGNYNLENMPANSANKFASDEQLACFNCKITESKVWRAGFGLRRRLCNECGLHYAKIGHHRRVDVCWCCCRKHAGECDDMRSVLKLLERKAAVNNDKSLDERQKTELGIKLDQALKNAHSNSASPLPVRDHRTSTRYDVRPPNTATHTTPPLPFANMAREFRAKGGGNVPASATPIPLQHHKSQAKVNQPTASGTPTQPSLTQPGRSSEALNYTYTGCVICRSPKHNLGSCPSRLDSEIVRSQHAKILADESIPLAKRAELASGLALYMNNRVVMKTSRSSR